MNKDSNKEEGVNDGANVPTPPTQEETSTEDTSTEVKEEAGTDESGRS